MKSLQLTAHSRRITHLSGSDNYTLVHFVDAPELLIARTLRLSQQHLPDFIRIHKRYAVNPRFIQQIRQFDSGSLELLVHKQWLAVGRRRKTRTLQQIQAYFHPGLIPGLPPPPPASSAPASTGPGH